MNSSKIILRSLKSLALVLVLSLGFVGCQCSKTEPAPEAVVEDVVPADQLNTESAPEEVPAATGDTTEAAPEAPSKQQKLAARKLVTKALLQRIIKE